MFKSIRTRIVVIFATICIAIATILSVINYYEAKNALQKEIFDKSAQLAKTESNSINEWLRGISIEVSSLAKTSDMYEMDWERQIPIMRSVIDQRNNYESVFLAYPDGSARSDRNHLIEVSDRDWFKGSIKGELVFSEILESRETGNLVVVVSAPIESPDQKDPVGVLAFTVQLEKLMELVLDVHGFEGWVVDENMTTIAHFDTSYVGNQDIFRNNPALKQQAQQMSKGETGQNQYTFEGVKKFASYAPVEIADWSVSFSAVEDEVLAPIKQMLSVSIIIIVVVIFIVIGISWFIGGAISKPILEIIEGFRDIENGDLTKEFASKSNDEIGRFAVAFNQVLHNLRELIRGVVETAGVVNDGSVQLAGMANEQAEVVSQIATVYEQVAQGSQQQSEDVINIKDTIDGLSKAIEGVAEGAQQQVSEVNITTERVGEMINGLNRALEFLDLLADAAGANVKQASEGEKIVANVAQGMENLNESIENTLNNVKELQTNSQQIENIVRVIEEIADQTNLLALNAAIEAARAGEYGKGFAVVAEEVRVLAARVRNSTSEINTIITGLYESITKTVDDVKANSDQIAESTQFSIEARASLGKIASDASESVKALDEFRELTTRLKVSSQNVEASVAKILDVAEENSASSEEMFASSGNVVNLIESLAAVTEENSASAEEVAASSEEQSAAIEELAGSAASLEEVSDKLKAATSSFRV